MNWFISTDGTGTDIHLTFSAKSKCKVISYVSCMDSGIVYNVRHDNVDGQKSVIMKVPFSPKNILVSVDCDIANCLSVQIIPTTVKKYAIPVGDQQKEFMSLIQAFTLKMNEGTLLPSDNIIKSFNGTFKIVLFDMIRDYEGRHKGTPCQIGEKSGIIECDYYLLSKHTISGQIALLCHEYAHFYENPKYGIPKSSEDGADMYGMILFLGSGYGETEYLNAFRDSFKHVDTDENKKRLAKMKSLAAEINSGKIFQKPY